MAEAEEPTRLVGVVDVVVHEARDIQNICIYHKQDVYAKLRLTTDAPGSAVSTRTVNGGGRNPVFNQTIRLGVRAAGPPPPSVRCEVWMLSRVRNFLEDQLLGFALVPLSDVAAAGGRLAGGDFPLSSTDLSRSPSGFVKLSVEYTGSLTELMPVDVAPSPPHPVSAATTTVLEEEDSSSVVVPCELSKIEFPDLKAADENNMMVSEYFGIPCTSMDTPEDDDDDCPNHQAGVRVVESFTAVACPDDPVKVSKDDTDTPASSPSAGSPPPPQQKDRSTEDGAGTTTEVASPPAPVISVDIVLPQHSVVRQDIVDMYMRSMQQFTESLANMKLPMDVVNSNGNDSSGGSGNVDAAIGDSGADQKLPAAKKTNSRVFYGSRAFF